MNKNHKVLKIWKTDWKKMQNFFKDYKNIFEKIIEGENLEKYFDFFNEFAKESRIKIENIAKSSDKITNILFFGKNYFEDPFCANWLLIGGNLTKTTPNFYVSNGSGRTSKPTIIFKPK